MNEENKENQLNIELNEDVADGNYSNLAVITHSQSEFVLDFIRMMPNVPKAKVKSRVIMTPLNAKKLLAALGENIRKFEQINGVIQDSGNPSIPPINFNIPPAQA